MPEDGIGSLLPSIGKDRECGFHQTTGSLPSNIYEAHDGTANKTTRQNSWRSVSSQSSQGDALAVSKRQRPKSLIARSATTASLAKLFSRNDEPVNKLRRLSRAPTTSSTASSSSCDWKCQKIECYGALEPEGSVRPKTPYLIVTREVIVRVGSRNDAIALFPELAKGAEDEKIKPITEPPLIISVSRVVAAFKAESTRPSFGIEIWWDSPITPGFSRTSFFFNLPNEREDILRALHGVQASDDSVSSASISPEVDAHLCSIALQEDPKYAHQRPEIFPIALRSIPRGATSQGFREVSTKTRDTPPYYLVVSANLVFIVEVSRSPDSLAGTVTSKLYKTGLAALERFDGHWADHEQRFVIRFRVPWQQTFTIELASRYYRRIVLTLLKADSLIRPHWPDSWRYGVVFRVNDLSDHAPPFSALNASALPEHLSFNRTLDSYLLAYGCSPVQWECTWHGWITPEFRLLPQRDGRAHTALQLGAVLRALRYQTFFRSISFHNVDISPLSAMKGDLRANAWTIHTRSSKSHPVFPVVPPLLT
jgi:hypothetical protein